MTHPAWFQRLLLKAVYRAQVNHNEELTLKEARVDLDEICEYLPEEVRGVLPLPKLKRSLAILIAQEWLTQRTTYYQLTATGLTLAEEL